MRLPQMKTLLALAAALGVSAAGAAQQWVTVMTVDANRIEFDKSRITHKSEGIAMVWSRMALGRDYIDDQGLRYTAIEALSRYDCENRSFATLRRIYRRDAKVVRDETIDEVRELVVEANSVDDKLLTAVCQPGGVATPQPSAGGDKAAASPAPAGKASAMYADMRSADAPVKPRTLQVADTAAAPAKPGEKPADKSAAKPGEKPAESKSGERPHFIELPKVDKSQAEDAKGGAKPDDKAATKGAPAKSEKAAEKPVVARQDLERLYATSGPRKAAKPKIVEPTIPHNIHWAYDGDGAPANWDKLRGDYATCGSGTRQSPIDIRDTIKVDLEPIVFDYKPSQFRITDNGHTIQVDVGEGSSIRVMERQFQLLQFHFHKPSEERINGKSYDMVAHFVHRDDEGRLAVVAVLMDKGMEHPLIQTLWNNMPLERGQSISPATVIDLNRLLPPPDRRAYYTYMGSLTTPPCSEDVLWMVLKEPIPLSPAQLSIFSRVYNHNARPVQPANGRLVKETR